MGNQSIADKVRKIIAKAESTSSPNEAEAFMAKAQAMLEAHGMSLLEVGRLGEDEIGCTDDAGRYTKMETSFRDLAFVLAEYYGCEGVIRQKRVYCEKKKQYVTRFSVDVYGRESARVTFTLMWPYVKRAVLDSAFALYNEDRKEHGKPVHSRSVYMRQVATALEYRVRKLVREMRVERAAKGVASTGVNALVPVDLIQQLLPDNLRTARSTKKTTTERAHAAAQDIGIDRQVNTSNARRLTNG